MSPASAAAAERARISREQGREYRARLMDLIDDGGEKGAEADGDNDVPPGRGQAEFRVPDAGARPPPAPRANNDLPGSITETYGRGATAPAAKRRRPLSPSGAQVVGMGFFSQLHTSGRGFDQVLGTTKFERQD